MINQFYYDLKSPDRLPPGSRFLDPYDHTPFLPTQGETLDELINRVEAHRKAENYPALDPDSLKQLIIDSLFATTPTKYTEGYFEKKSVSPTTAQFFSFIKSTALNLVSGQIVSPKQRKVRAEHCLGGCTFHSENKKWDKKVVKAIAKFVGVKEATVDPKEEALGSCNMCGGCALQAKVAYSLHSVLASITPEQIDQMFRTYGNRAFDVCWIFNEAQKQSDSRHLLQSKILAASRNSSRSIAAIQHLQKG